MTDATLDNDSSTRKRRKLRPLVITMGGMRQKYIEEMFACMSDEFEPPTFSPGVPSRSLRSRGEFLKIVYEVGLIPEVEMNALAAAQESPEYQERPDRLWECLKDVPVASGRKGSESDIKLHYSVELWQKAKTLNRGRATLACLFAHLRAMKTCVEGGYDFILEDNVRVPPQECAQRIWEAVDASNEWQQADEEQQCHLRYFGWLGSLPNLDWVIHTHAPRTNFARDGNGDDVDTRATVFPWPIKEDFDVSLDDEEENQSAPNLPHETTFGHTKAGGTAIWGAYAYWISEQGLDNLLQELGRDVGSLLWKGKRSKVCFVKPIDKVLPRKVTEAFGRSSIHVSTQPCFFRAPMLTSKIHAQWDAEFCKSTELQMSNCGLRWEDLWLSKSERRIVQHHDKTGDWLTMNELSEMMSETELESPENGERRLQTEST